MSAYCPPLEILPIFDPAIFVCPGSSTGGGGPGGGGHDATKLDFPTAQGGETFPYTVTFNAPNLVTGTTADFTFTGGDLVSTFLYPGMGFDTVLHPPLTAPDLVPKSYVDSLIFSGPTG